MVRLKENYKKSVVPELMKAFQFKNVHQVPIIKRIYLNVGVGDASKSSGLLEESVKTLTSITGQKAVTTRAKRSVSNFKVREGMVIGCKVSLAGDRMWEFFDRLVTLTIPRIRDFRGISRKGMDGRGNFSMGVKEQIIFHEINHEKVKNMHGMDITVVTSANNDKEGLALLEQLGMPFRKANKGGN